MTCPDAHKSVPSGSKDRIPGEPSEELRGELADLAVASQSLAEFGALLLNYRDILALLAHRQTNLDGLMNHQLINTVDELRGQLGSLAQKVMGFSILYEDVSMALDAADPRVRQKEPA